MFWYQCRYCKVTFDQWGKLVKHRTESHQTELEALKAAAAKLSVKRMDAHKKSHFATAKGRPHLANTRKVNGHAAASKTPETRQLPKASSSMFLLSPQSPSSRSVDARDLEDQELHLCMPRKLNSPCASSNGSKVSAIASHSVLSQTNIGLLSPPETPYRNRSSYQTSLRNNLFTSPNYLTPPLTPTPPTSTYIPGELALNMNWNVPYSKTAVMYHEINDDDEIEICVTPSVGSRISVTKHLSYSEEELDISNGYHKVETFEGNGNHIIVEEFDHELQMTCSRNTGKISSRSGVLGKAEASTRRRMTSTPLNKHKPGGCLSQRNITKTLLSANDSAEITQNESAKDCDNNRKSKRTMVLTHKTLQTSSSKLQEKSRASLQRSRSKFKGI